MVKMLRNRHGFTLVEIMIVVLIIGILMAIAMPGFRNSRLESRKKTCARNLKMISDAQQWYATMQNKKDTDPIELRTLYPIYMKTQPKCPSGGTYGHFCQAGHDPTCSIHGTLSNARR